MLNHNGGKWFDISDSLDVPEFIWTAWPHLVNAFCWFVSSEQRVLRRWAVISPERRPGQAKVCPWRHFPLNHLNYSNPCLPQLAATTTCPCGLFRMWFKSLQCGCDWGISTKRARTLPQALQLLHHWFRFWKPIGKRCRFCHATEERAQLHNQPVATLRQPFSPQFLTLQKVRSISSVSSAVLKAEKAWAWQTPHPLCWEEP